MRILDATSSNRSMWYQKNNPLTIYMDKRNGVFSPKTPNMKEETLKKCGLYKIFPDVQAVWQNLPFRSECFDLIVFDPPHTRSSTSGMAQRWSNREIDVKEVLAIMPYTAMFGTRSGLKNNTHWILFLKV